MEIQAAVRSERLAGESTTGIRFTSAACRSLRQKNLPSIRQLLLDTGWQKQHTWISLMRWLDEEARQRMFSSI